MKRTLALVALLLAANAAYAFSLPAAMDAVDPIQKAGYVGRASPVGAMDVRFVDVTAATGIDVRHAAWGDDPPYPAIITGGVAAADVDGNGWTDLYFSPGGVGHPGRLYLNQGHWGFTDATAQAHLLLDGLGAGATFGDFDNDGDPDLFVLVDATAHLYRNDKGLFTDITKDAGVALDGLCDAPCQPSSATWLDFDEDGRLDLALVNNLDWHDPDLHTSGANYGSFVQFGRGQRTVLFHNEGGITSDFANKTATPIFRDVTLDTDAWDVAKGLGITATDLDGDGHVDLLTANDHTPNAYLHNDGNGGSSELPHFQNLARSRGLDERTSSMGIAAGDLDGDGRMDLLVSNFRGEGLSAYIQQGDGTFVNDAVPRGLEGTKAVTGWGVQIADFDLDGWPDIAHAAGRAAPLAPHERDIHYALAEELRQDTRDQLFHNIGQGRFEDATKASGFGDDGITRSLLAVDLDNDGDLDVVRVNLDGQGAQVLRTDRVGAAAANGWIQLELVGKAANRDGFGARIEVTTPDGRTQVVEATAGQGYESGGPGRLTIGLGAADSATVRVHWPGGAVQDLGKLETGFHVIQQQ